MKDNKKILDQVKNAVSSKKLNEKKTKNDYRYKDNSNETIKIVDSWIKNNAEKITKEVISEHIKKLFK
jgi:UDP-N-acetylglucosamine 2-epimerase